MAITYDAPSNTITVTGYSESVPCTFEDVYQADQTGGWGVVSKQGVVQYHFDCLIKIGDGSTETWFADTLKQLTWSDNFITAQWKNLITVMNNAHFRVGILEDATTRKTSSGCHFMCLESTYKGSFVQSFSTSETEIYSSSFMATGQTWTIGLLRANHKVYNVLAVRRCDASPWANSGTAEWFNLIIEKGGNALSYGVGSLFENIHVTDCYGIVWSQLTYNFSVKNVYGRGLTKTATLANSWSGTGYLINADLDVWTFTWTGTCTGKVYRQYTFNLKVTEQDGTVINGATVTLKDKDDNQVFSVSTAADGTITEQTVTRGYYDQAHGDTLQDYSPHKLIIEKAGFQTYEIQGITMEKIDWTIKLAKAVGVFLSFGSPVVNLKKTDPENKNVIVL